MQHEENDDQISVISSDSNLSESDNSTNNNMQASSSIASRRRRQQQSAWLTQSVQRAEERLDRSLEVFFHKAGGDATTAAASTATSSLKRIDSFCSLGSSAQDLNGLQRDLAQADQDFQQRTGGSSPPTFIRPPRSATTEAGVSRGGSSSIRDRAQRPLFVGLPPRSNQKNRNKAAADESLRSSNNRSAASSLRVAAPPRNRVGATIKHTLDRAGQELDRTVDFLKQQEATTTAILEAQSPSSALHLDTLSFSSEEGSPCSLDGLRRDLARADQEFTSSAAKDQHGTLVEEDSEKTPLRPHSEEDDYSSVFTSDSQHLPGLQKSGSSGDEESASSSSSSSGNHHHRRALHHRLSSPLSQVSEQSQMSMPTPTKDPKSPTTMTMTENDDSVETTSSPISPPAVKRKSSPPPASSSSSDLLKQPELSHKSPLENRKAWKLVAGSVAILSALLSGGVYYSHLNSSVSLEATIQALYQDTRSSEPVVLPRTPIANISTGLDKSVLAEESPVKKSTVDSANISPTPTTPEKVEPPSIETETSPVVCSHQHDTVSLNRQRVKRNTRMLVVDRSRGRSWEQPETGAPSTAEGPLDVPLIPGNAEELFDAEEFVVSESAETAADETTSGDVPMLLKRVRVKRNTRMLVVDRDYYYQQFPEKRGGSKKVPLADENLPSGGVSLEAAEKVMVISDPQLHLSFVVPVSSASDAAAGPQCHEIMVWEQVSTANRVAGPYCRELSVLC